MKYTAPVPETITLRPALASVLFGSTPHDLWLMAGLNQADPVIRSCVIHGGTEYRLDDLILMLRALTIYGHPIPDQGEGPKP